MFALANVLIDIEPVMTYVLTGNPVHAYAHTYLGATLIAFFCTLCGRAICERLLKLWNMQLDERQAVWLTVSTHISPRVALLSSLLGAWSHILLDSFMHADIRPWWPLSEDNSLRSLVPVEYLHALCVMCGIWGGLRLFTRHFDAIHTATRQPSGENSSLRLSALSLLRLCLGFVRTSFAIATLFLVLVLGVEVLGRSELRSAQFDQNLWATHKMGGTRVQMADDLVRKLKERRHDRDSVRQLLGEPGNSGFGSSYWSYPLGVVISGYYYLEILFDDSGQVADIQLYRS